jgi:predicted Zn-dependent protease
MYTREEVRAIVDKVIDMASADAVEVNFSGGERSGTRWANSSITTNLVQYDRNVSVTVRLGSKTGNANTRDFTDAGLLAMVDEAMAEAREAEDSDDLPELLGPQEFLPVDAATPDMVAFGPAERAAMVRDSLDIAESKGVLGAGYIPKIDQTSCEANSNGLFAYYRVAESGFVLTCRMPDGSGSGWAGITGCKDVSMIDAKAITDIASDKAVNSRAPRALHRHSRAARKRSVPLPHDRHLQSEQWRRRRPRWRRPRWRRRRRWWCQRVHGRQTAGRQAVQ